MCARKIQLICKTLAQSACATVLRLCLVIVCVLVMLKVWFEGTVWMLSKGWLAVCLAFFETECATGLMLVLCVLLLSVVLTFGTYYQIHTCPIVVSLLELIGFLICLVACIETYARVE